MTLTNDNWQISHFQGPAGAVWGLADDALLDNRGDGHYCTYFTMANQRKFFVGGNWKMNGDKASIDGIITFMKGPLNADTGKKHRYSAAELCRRDTDL